jgi:hypothetical protein
MIGLSRFRGNAPARSTLAALLLMASTSVASCNIGTCNGTACTNDLEIFFDGVRSYDGGGYDGGTIDGGAPADSIEIEIAVELGQTFSSIRTCWLTLAGGRELVCDLQGQLQVLDANPVRLSGYAMRPIQVTMSMNGDQLSQQMLSASYVTQTCACGAGTSTIGTAHIQLPPP